MKTKIYSPTKTAKSDFKKRKKNAKKALASFKDEDGNQKENKIERKVREVLDDLGVYYTQEYAIRHRFSPKGKEYYKVYDFLVELGSSVKVLIEAHGDYYHYYGYYFEDSPIEKGTYVQKKNVRNDKIKIRIAKQRGIPLLIIWEKDIKKGKPMISQILLDFFKQYGLLLDL